jgi:hypothetical protein
LMMKVGSDMRLRNRRASSFQIALSSSVQTPLFFTLKPLNDLNHNAKALIRYLPFFVLSVSHCLEGGVEVLRDLVLGEESLKTIFHSPYLLHYRPTSLILAERATTSAFYKKNLRHYGTIFFVILFYICCELLLQLPSIRDKITRTPSFTSCELRISHLPFIICYSLTNCVFKLGVSLFLYSFTLYVLLELRPPSDC